MNVNSERLGGALLQLNTQQSDMQKRALEAKLYKWASAYENADSWHKMQVAAINENDGQYRRDLIELYKSKVKDSAVSIPRCLMLTYCLEEDRAKRLAFAHSLLHDDEPTVIKRHNWGTVLGPLSEAYRKANGDAIMNLEVPLFPAYMKDANNRLLSFASMSGGGDLLGGADESETAHGKYFAKDRPWVRNVKQRVSLSPGAMKKLSGAGFVLQVAQDGTIDLSMVEDAIGQLFNNISNLNQRIQGLESAAASSSRSTSRPRQQSRPRSTRTPGPCYNCGGAHLQRDCNQRSSVRSSSNRKVYGSGVDDPCTVDESSVVAYSRKFVVPRIRLLNGCNLPRSKDVSNGLIGGNFMGCLSNVELDDFLRAWYTMEMADQSTLTPTILPADCALDIFSNDHYKEIFTQAKGAVIIPFHSHFHWAAVVVKNNQFHVADSAPRAEVAEEIRRLFARVREWISGICMVNHFVIRQPYGSNECGIHAMVNAVHLVRDEFFDCRGMILSYGQLRPTFRDILDGKVCPETLIQGARLLAREAHLKFTEHIPRERVVFILDRYKAFGVQEVTVITQQEEECIASDHVLVKRKNNRWMTSSSMLPAPINDEQREYVGIVDVATFRHLETSRHLKHPIDKRQSTMEPLAQQKPAKEALSTKPVTRKPQAKEATRTNAKSSKPPDPKPPEQRSSQANEDDNTLLEVPEMFHDLMAKNVYPPDCVEYRSGDQMQMEELRKILASTEVKEVPALYAKALERSTRLTHLRMLRWIATNVTVEGAIDMAILSSVQAMAKAKMWAPTTTMTKMTSIQGALKALYLYRDRQISVQLKNCSRWLLAIRGLTACVQLHRTNQPKPVTEKQLFAAYKDEPRMVVKAALEVAWLTAARGGDIRQVRAADITFPAPSKANPVPDMTVTFRSGKTAKRSQYTVGVPLPSPSTLKFIKEKQQEGSYWAFPTVKGDDLKVALRRADQDLEQRSIRRGRLQHLARGGMKDSQLLELSRHATLAMLRRYLDMGTVSSTTHETAALAAATQASL